jgi:hypothetical protein
VGLRQWVLTFPFAWRRRLAQDGELLGRVTRIFVPAEPGHQEALSVMGRPLPISRRLAPRHECRRPSDNRQRNA